LTAAAGNGILGPVIFFWQVQPRGAIVSRSCEGGGDSRTACRAALSVRRSPLRKNTSGVSPDPDASASLI